MLFLSGFELYSPSFLALEKFCPMTNFNEQNPRWNAYTIENERWRKKIANKEPQRPEIGKEIEEMLGFELLKNVDYKSAGYHSKENHNTTRPVPFTFGIARGNFNVPQNLLTRVVWRGLPLADVI